MLYLMLVLSVLFVGAVPGCSKEESELKRTPLKAGSGGIGPCEIFEKLPGDIARSVEINYGNKVKLLGITANKLSQNQLKVSYYWQPREFLGEYKQVFVHFTNTSIDKILINGDHEFCQNHSFGEIKSKFIRETYVIDIPEAARGQEAYILVGLYAPGLKSAPRLEVISTKWATPSAGGSAANVEKLKL